MTYFTIDELTASATAKRLHIPNTPGPSVRKCLEELVAHVLDPARERLGAPIEVTSGYRSSVLNVAVGGAATSQHVRGQAADITCADNAHLFYLIWKHLPYDQLIWEKGDALQPAWIHVSYNPERTVQRRECLRTINGRLYFAYIPKEL